MVSRLCLVRHGETDWNVARRLQGHRDIALNATGLAQAQRTAAALAHTRFDACYTSDLQRAHTTARCILAAMEHPPAHTETCTWLRERHYGLFQGLTLDEAATQHPALWARMKARDPDFIPPGDSESLSGFAVRIKTHLAALHATHPGQTVLCVTHGGVLDVIYRLATGKPLSAPRDFPIPNAALSWLSSQPSREPKAPLTWVIDLWGHEITHNTLDEL